MKKRKIISKIVLILLTLFTIPAAYSQDECCNEELCKTEAQKLADELTEGLELLGPDPNDLVLRERILDTFKVNRKKTYKDIIKRIKRIDDFSNKNPQGQNCVTSFIESEDVLDWFTHLILKYHKSKGRSSEFCKGVGLHVDLNSGVKDLVKSNESFSSSSRLLFTYTFAKNECGGRLRLMLGPSVYYQDRELFFLINPRAEFRIKDFGSDMISIGNIKLITQINFNRNHLLAGVGAGVELDRFGVQILGDYQLKVNSYSIQTGIFYRFKL